MRLDTLGLETSKRYFHHYNFPPFSVGEAGFMRGPKRRDIGHGALAERALVPMIPSQEEFPYTIRVVSDILESNGSSSMASVCGSSLSLMDAGVPLKRPVAGIAMGLIKEGDDYIVLTDIAGVEDHLGDMDFKVAGTENGITALQMDIKITGVTFDILRDALTQAQEGRTFILGKMAEVDRRRRARELSKYAPRISTIQIDPDKIGLLIGKGGETIRGLSEEFEAQIDVNDEGQVLVYAQTGAQGDALVDRIRSMTKEVEVGDEFARQGRQDDHVRRVRRARQGHRRPAAHLQRLARPAGRRRSRRSSTRATRSPSAWSRSTASAAASACASPRTRRSPARPSRSWPRSAPAAAAAAAATAATAARAATAAAAAAATAAAARARRGGRGGERRPRARPRPGPRLAPTPGVARAPADRAGLGAAGRHGAHALRAVRGPRASSWAPGSRGETRGRGRPLALPRAHAVPRHGALRSAEIDQLFDGMGAELNAGTDKEGTTVYARMLDQHLPRAFDVMADMVWRPAFHDVDPEREVVLEEIAMYEDDPQDMVFDVLGDAVFGEHPLGRPIIGRAPVIRDTPVDEIAAFHARRYVPGSVVIAAAGSVDHDAIVELAERTLGGLRRGASRAAGA